MSGRKWPRRLPGRVQTCARCGARIVFARTVRTANGGGGRLMPLDLAPTLDGNVAVREMGAGLRARVLGKDETHDVWAELRAMPHFATCTADKVTPPAAPPDELAARRAHHQAGKR